MAQVSSQEFLEFEEVKEGIVVMKNRSLRGILMVSSLNFALKSAEEQDAIIYNFQSFLNSLDFSCQIHIQSRRLNIIGYLDKVRGIGQREKNELLKIQVEEYANFVDSIVAKGTIIQKNFYIVIPFSLSETKAAISDESKKTIKAAVLKSKADQIMSEEDFRRAKTQLLQRMEFVALGIRGCGLQAMPLNTLEVIELFWGLYHPKEAERGYFPNIPPELLN